MTIVLAASGCSPREPAQAVAEDVKESPPPVATRIATSKDSIHAQTEQAVIARNNKPISVTIDTAMFAGGCFWSMERPFQHVPGVIGTTVGYAGGHVDSPTYEQVNTGTTGPAETVQVEFDRSRVGYEKLLDIYWRNIDPLTRDRQFCDGEVSVQVATLPRDACKQESPHCQRQSEEREIRTLPENYVPFLCPLVRVTSAKGQRRDGHRNSYVIQLG